MTAPPPPPPAHTKPTPPHHAPPATPTSPRPLRATRTTAPPGDTECPRTPHDAAAAVQLKRRLKRSYAYRLAASAAGEEARYASALCGEASCTGWCEGRR